MPGTEPTHSESSVNLPGPRNQSWAIFGISVLGLFLELVLIRWIGTEIRIFAYLQNTVLVVCFLGLGIGAFTSRRPAHLATTLGLLCLLLLLMTTPWTRPYLVAISDMLSVLEDFVIWYSRDGTDRLETIWSVTLGLSLTFFLMLLIFTAFLPIGRILGRLLDEHPHTIWAYSMNIAGSLVGTWLLIALSLLEAPPTVWFGTIAVMSLAFLSRNLSIRRFEIGLAVGVVLLALLAGHNPNVIKLTWSPYQKLALLQGGVGTRHVGEYVLNVNNVGYQAMIDLSVSNVAANPKRFPPIMAGFSQYDIPALLHPNPRKVLIVGSGTGNDVAGLLRNGAQHVTGVEIDPVIIEFGRRYHPEKPMDNPAVRIVNDDARSFFATSKERFDLIVFGLLDSHTTTSMTNARLDHYVYTRESIAQAHSLLNEGGMIVLSFSAKRPYITDRVARSLNMVFGHKPLVFEIPYSHYGWGGAMFVAGAPEALREQLERHPKLANLIKHFKKARPLTPSYTTQIATDDWPYFYLPEPMIPKLFYLLAGLMLLVLLVGSRIAGSRGLILGWNRQHWHFFFLGGGFLLLEVQNISKATLALGSTWWVNSVIISGVLLMVLLANAVAKRFPSIPLTPVFVCLFATCAGLYFLDLSVLAGLAYPLKSVIVGLITTLPLFFSGIIFIRSFSIEAHKDQALGANLVGSLFGGLMQSLTFIIGVKALLLVVAGFYLCAMFTRPKTLS